MNKSIQYHGHPRFNAILDELRDLHSEKNRQYATQSDPLGNFRRTGKLISKLLKPEIDPTLASALILMSKQIDGVYEMVGDSKKGTFDSVIDKLRDVSVYSVIAQIIIEENEKNRPQK